MKEPICAETPSTSRTGDGVGIGVDEMLDDVEMLDSAMLAVADELSKLVEDEIEKLEVDEVAPSR